MQPELRHLRVFLAVADQGSANLAGAALFGAQSAVSRSIHKLESELGVQLFERRARGMSRPRTPAASFERFWPSLLSRAVAVSSVLPASAAGTTTTPSSSATTTSPGFTSAPAHMTGMFTEPSVAFTVPRAEIALLHTGNFIPVSMKGMKWVSPRGPMMIDPATRDPVQTVYIRRVEMVNGKPWSIEFDKVENVKDPGV